MDTNSYTTTLTVAQSPKEVFDAINNVRGWWSEEIDGLTDKLGAEFRYRYKELHRSAQKITEFLPNTKVVWHISDAELIFAKNKTEWNGTSVVFEITRNAGKTKVRFTHVGLNRSLECYGGCTDAWGFYIRESLRRLITTGKGLPNRKQ